MTAVPLKTTSTEWKKEKREKKNNKNVNGGGAGWNFILLDDLISD